MKSCIIILAITLASAVNALAFNNTQYRQQEELSQQQFLEDQKKRDELIASKLKHHYFQQKIPPEFLIPIGACGMFNPPPHCGEAYITTKVGNIKWLGYGSAWKQHKFNTPKVQGIEDLFQNKPCEQYGDCVSYGYNPPKYLLKQLKKRQMRYL
ncbi:UNKNOWN [Stylonychia lemnae]|uniref:Uncharacterized protein n=1 Tax=Stylonychia lemnae TaxID=5949 RepID=A0A078AEI5_STYLE|nr:UNKNOWN [Stylonychia lemnae]|eukprot:CDW80684.1 UNKNOWN [Stylonychia lemnae]